MSELKIEARVLKPFAEPVVSDSLVVHEVYFSVQFIDEAMTMPEVLPFVFLGRLEPADPNLLFFQDLPSFTAGVRYATSRRDSGAKFFKASTREVKHIFEFERALDALMLCSVRRRKLDIGSP
jgi:hypothetical protein